jgi:hypothetical protein
VVETEQRLLLWLKDEKVIEVYGVLGIIDEQIRPFREWLAQAKTVEVVSAGEDVMGVSSSCQSEVRAATIELYRGMRRTAVMDAIKYELAKRNNERLARRVPGVRPVLMIDSFRQAIEHARRREEMLLDILEPGE